MKKIGKLKGVMRFLNSASHQHPSLIKNERSLETGEKAVLFFLALPE